MKNRIRIFSILLLLLVLLVSASISYAADTEDTTSLMAKLGQIFKVDSETRSSENIYARGNSGGTITISDIEKATQFYITAGNDENTARQKAVEYMLQRDALYQKAIDSGYTVTDTEVTEYLNNLKSTLDTANNKEDVYALINQFNSEEDYWDYQFQIYQINLPIEKYVQALKEEFYNSQLSTYSEDTVSKDLFTDFNNYLNSLKTDLVEAENYTIYN